MAAIRLVRGASAITAACTVMMASFACAPTPPKPPDTSMNPGGRGLGGDVLALYGEAMSQRGSVAHGRSVGKIFLLRKNTERVELGHECASFTVRYDWTGARQLRTINLHSDADVAAQFPINPGFRFGAYFQNNQTVRIRVASPGSWHLDTSSVKLPRSCRAGATHYVKTITVGAFVITALSNQSAGATAGTGAAGGHFDANEQRVDGAEGGRVWDCDVNSPERPPEACTDPVEVEIGPIEDLQVSDDVPGEPTPNRPRPESPKPESLCYQAVTLTGDPDKDIVAVGDACGAKFGLRPVGSAMVRTLGEDDGWQKQYELSLTAGRCYRIVAVGDSGIQSMDIGIKSSTSGEELAVDGQHGRVAVIDPRGPYCAKKTETVILYAKVEKGRGRYGLWQWRKDQ